MSDGRGVRQTLRGPVLAALLSLLWQDPVEAAGFFLQEQGGQGVGRAHAGDGAAARDASTIFFNPAGLTELPGPEAEIGAHILVPDIAIINRGTTASTPGTGGVPLPLAGSGSGNPTDPTLVANLYAAYPLGDGRTWLGLGLSAPFGLALKYDTDWFGRYDSLESRLMVLDIAPTAAYRISDLISVGAGLDVQYAKAQLANAIPNPLTPGGPTAPTDGLFNARGDDWSVGFNFGVLVKPMAGTRVGLHYRSAITHDLTGDVAIEGLSGPIAGLNGIFAASAELDLPDIVTFAVAQEVTPDLTLLGHVMWFGWDRFEEIRIKFANGSPDAVIPTSYHDTLAVAVGAEYALNEAWRLRTGFQYDETPTTDGFRDTRVPDGDRYWVAGGVTHLFSDCLSLDFAYAHVFLSGSDIVLDRPFFPGTPLASNNHIEAEAQSHVDVVSLKLRLGF